jgi:hypothetical protein
MSLIPLCAACEVEQVVKGLQGFVEIQQPVAESVSLGDLQKLRAAGPMSRYEIQMHDELQSMLAGGKPKAIAAIEDSFAATFECPRQIRSMPARRRARKHSGPRQCGQLSRVPCGRRCPARATPNPDL